MSINQQVDSLIIRLFKANIIEFGDFRLKSGIMSPFYFDLRPIISYPTLLSKLADVYISKMKNLEFDHIAGIPFTGLPIATAISIRGNIPMVHCRSKQKEYGTRRSVEGIHKTGDRVLLIDDTITDGASKLTSINLFKENHFTISDVLIFLNRKQKGDKKLEKHNINLISICDIYQLLDILHRKKLISMDKYKTTVSFFNLQQ